MTGIKRLFAALLSVALLFTFALAAIPDPTDEFYTNDFAEVLSDSTKSYILDHSVALEQKTGAQIVVSTVKTLDGKSERDYGLEMARQYKIGSEKNNGVLILLALEERKIDVEVGYGLEGALNDSKVGRLIDETSLDALKANRYDEGIKALYTAILAEVYTEYNLEMPEDVQRVDVSEDDSSSGIGAIIGIIIFLIVIGSIFGGRGGGFFFFGGPGHWGGGSGGGGFGGFGGGSGGGFSGGGGSFGGGGGSRGF